MCRRDCFTAILQRSGVGNAELLAEFNIPRCMNYPASAKIFRITWRCICIRVQRTGFPLPCPAVVESAEIGAEWLFGGTGVGASNHFEEADLFAAVRNLRGRIFSTISASGD